MRILLTVDPEIPVPPRLYGGIERIVGFLAEGLGEKGEEVTLLAHRSSEVKARLRPWPALWSQHSSDALRNTLHVRRIWRTEGPFDVVHSFARLMYLLPLLPQGIPKIQTYQRHVTPRSVRWGVFLAGSSLTFTACSRFLAEAARFRHERWEVVYNGARLNQYTCRESVPETAPLLFLGRLDRVKGPHHAIGIARRTGRMLILAGNRAERGPDVEYFEREIKPSLDGSQIRWVGPVDDREKNELLGQAAAVVFPVEWHEPCGIVMVEALACGTPVLATRRGSVPEMVVHGVTGWVADRPEQLDEGVRGLPAISRKTCREHAEKRFSAQVIADQYHALYRDLIRNGSKP